MASGRTHRNLNLIASVLLPGVAALAWFGGEYYLGRWETLAAVTGGYLLSTFGVNPDQDIWRRTFAERKGLWGSFLFYWSLPYGFLFRHRGISHEHIIGTLTRVVMMGLWALPILPLALGVSWLTVLVYSGWVFLGLTTADTMHIAADGGRRQREHAQ